MTMLQGTSCCGLKELSELRSGFYQPAKPEEIPAAMEKGVKAAMATVCTYAYPQITSYAHDAQGRLVPYTSSREWSCRFSHILFTDHHAHAWNVGSKNGRPFRVPYGKAFAKEILKHKLGHVSCSKKALNPNSNNDVTAWIWTVDRKALKGYFDKYHPFTPQPKPSAAPSPVTVAPAPAPVVQEAVLVPTPIPVPVAPPPPRASFPTAQQVAQRMEELAQTPANHATRRKIYRLRNGITRNITI